MTTFLLLFLENVNVFYSEKMMFVRVVFPLYNKVVFVLSICELGKYLIIIKTMAGGILHDRFYNCTK